MARATPQFAPRLMPSPEAAHYIGVSESTLRALQIPRKILGGKRLYDVIDLDAFASALPVEGQAGDGGVNTCDEILRGIG